ncbi:MAG: DEAD/DEAH box helicase [Clostridiales bacterium]|nr:DEAD/DEAH box helicase [Clostridiales bacterium]
MLTATKKSQSIIVSGSTFFYKDTIKEIEGRKWDSMTKSWIVPLNGNSLNILSFIGAVFCQELQLEFGKYHSYDGTISIPLPIKATPYKHQIAAFNFALNLFESKKGFALLADMGTGKTITAIALMGRLFLDDKCRRVLIAAPKSILPVWANELNKFADFDYQIYKTPSDAKDSQFDLLSNKNKLNIVILNYESIWRLEKEFLEYKPDMIIADESSKIKNSTAKQSKALHILGNMSKYNIILSGTPITNSPLDIYSQYKFLNNKIFSENWWNFQKKYANFDQNNRIVGFKNIGNLLQRMHEVAYRVKLTSVVDMPPVVNLLRIVGLNPEQRKLYKELHKGLLHILDQQVSHDNVLVKLLKLSQFTGGFVTTDSGEVLPSNTAKLDELKNLLDEFADKKIVIFARFIAEINAICAILEQKEIKYSLVYGDTANRQIQVDNFQNDIETRVFVGQIATAGMGITLTAAHTTIYFSLDYSYANYEQSKSRTFRIGQSFPCTYIHLIVENSIDSKVFSALQNKKDIAKQLVDDFKSFE